MKVIDSLKDYFIEMANAFTEEDDMEDGVELPKELKEPIQAEAIYSEEIVKVKKPIVEKVKVSEKEAEGKTNNNKDKRKDNVREN